MTVGLLECNKKINYNTSASKWPLCSALVQFTSQSSADSFELLQFPCLLDWQERDTSVNYNDSLLSSARWILNSLLFFHLQKNRHLVFHTAIRRNPLSYSVTAVEPSKPKWSKEEIVLLYVSASGCNRSITTGC